MCAVLSGRADGLQLQGWLTDVCVAKLQCKLSASSRSAALALVWCALRMRLMPFPSVVVRE